MPNEVIFIDDRISYIDAAKRLNIKTILFIDSKKLNQDLKDMLESKPQEILLEEGQLVEVTSGPFKGEKAKVVKILKEKEEVIVELVEVAVPIPVTIKMNTIKVIQQ